jgi:hypothetical protein
MIENARPLLLEPAGKAVENVVQPDRIKSLPAEVQGLKHVFQVHLGCVGLEPLRGAVEAVRIDVEQGKTTRCRGQGMFEEVTRANADLEVVGRNLRTEKPRTHQS